MDVEFEIFDIVINNGGVGNGWACKDGKVYLIQKIYGTEPDLKIGDRVEAGKYYLDPYPYVRYPFRQEVDKNGFVDYFQEK